MRLLVRMVLSLVIGLAASSMGFAQAKEIPGDRITKAGTVEAIDTKARVLTLRDAKGELSTVDVPASVERFDALKVGDKITVTYYDNVTVRLKQPGEAPVNTLEGGLTPAAGGKPAGTMAAQRTMTAKVEAIDPKVPSITFTGPNGWKYSRRVEDKKALEKVKVGDQVDFTWTEAVLLSVDTPKK
jgi:Cu/Ag efflux protein CusF